MFRILPRIRIYVRKYTRKSVAVSTIALITFFYICKALFGDRRNDTTDDSYAKQDLASDTQAPFFQSCRDIASYLKDPEYERMNATFVILTRNKELNDVMFTMESLENHFNQWFNYPYVFLNDEPFTEQFQEQIKTMTDAKVEFGTLSELEWEFPKDVRESFEFEQYVEDQGDRGIMYGNIESYHKMCRFYSGIFYKHPMVRQYEWYWRIEPDVQFFCDITYDPFFEMELRGKSYGFTILITELYWSVPNLFRITRGYIKEKQVKMGSLWKLFTKNFNMVDTKDDYLKKKINFKKDIQPAYTEKIAIDRMLDQSKKDAFNFDWDDTSNYNGFKSLLDRAQGKVPLFEDKFDNEEYNLCHFWSNFEIAKRTVFDNEIYDGYFQYLEESGGFWRERWGDAPVHSLGSALTLDMEEVHYFRDIGYKHSTLHHCPRNGAGEARIKYIPGSDRFKRPSSTRYDPVTENGIGCRCQCPPGKADIEDLSYPCIDHWLELAHEMEKNYNFANGEYYPYFQETQIEEQMTNDE